MKVSTKGVYAIEAMIDLGCYSIDHVESIKNIAKRRSLSEKYLEQIIGSLRRSGLIESVRGAGGGYRLKKAPLHISVLDILNAVDVDLTPVECLTNINSECNMDCTKCPTRVYWQKMLDEMLKVVCNVTLKDLIDREQALWIRSEPEYYI